MLILDISDRQNILDVDKKACKAMLSRLFQSEQIRYGEISVAIVGDAEMHNLNREYLAHDFPTDVLSFVLDRNGRELHGEIIVSADTAIERSLEFGWSPHNELTLYLIHGALHLVGYDDKSDDDRQFMREREQHYLRQFGIVNASASMSESVRSPSPPSVTPLKGKPKS
jgi:probable rRNA maturation factor